MKTAKITLSLDERTKNELNLYSEENDLTVSFICRKLIQKLLKGEITI